MSVDFSKFDFVMLTSESSTKIRYNMLGFCVTEQEQFRNVHTVHNKLVIHSFVIY